MVHNVLSFAFFFCSIYSNHCDFHKKKISSEAQRHCLSIASIDFKMSALLLSTKKIQVLLNSNLDFHDGRRLRIVSSTSHVIGLGLHQTTE